MLNLELLASTLGYQRVEPLTTAHEHVCDLALLDGKVIAKYASRHSYNNSCYHLRCEKETVQALSGHPNFPKFFGYLEDAPARNFPFPIPILLREYIPGEIASAKIIRNTPQAYQKLILALTDAHSAGYSGFDIKRCNIIITPKGNPVIIDCVASPLSRIGVAPFVENCLTDFVELDEVFRN